MLSSWPSALLAGIILGTLAGLGVGGGSLLILWLTLILQMPYPQARIINLLFFLPAAILSTFIRAKGKAISIKRIWPAVVAGCIGAVLAYYIGRNMDLALLKKVFGGLLLITGIRELLYRPRKAR